jgi:hypothetical protein
VFCGPEMLRGERFVKLEDLEGGRCAPNERSDAKEWFAANDARCDVPCNDAFERFEVVRDERAAKLA